ncbi:uncharacterized protein A4U43_C06F12580 [Asparagus officinalis]|uniref:Uncharacterized protein n=1 Tax=Asparagus officinalis TaxID=4686 RepID=A0A5P1ES12_ASPOF|nr:uncharacterized protein A4U43_C06F12580 [Asparagus officinalis]
MYSEPPEDACKVATSSEIDADLADGKLEEELRIVGLCGYRAKAGALADGIWVGADCWRVEYDFCGREDGSEVVREDEE